MFSGSIGQTTYIFGKKPLYYTRVNGNLIFASEIKSLLSHPQVKRQADVQALADFLSVRYVPGPATLFANIYKESFTRV
jgi:asparagine synthase (glutamine-hydrolysing)